MIPSHAPTELVERPLLVPIARPPGALSHPYSLLRSHSGPRSFFPLPLRARRPTATRHWSLLQPPLRKTGNDPWLACTARRSPRQAPLSLARSTTCSTFLAGCMQKRSSLRPPSEHLLHPDGLERPWATPPGHFDLSVNPLHAHAISSLPSITLEIWKRSARQIRSCWPLAASLTLDFSSSQGCSTGLVAPSCSVSVVPLVKSCPPAPPERCTSSRRWSGSSASSVGLVEPASAASATRSHPVRAPCRGC